MKILLLLSIISFVLMLSACSSNNAEKIFLNGLIYSLDDKNNIYEAVAIKDGIIIDLGTTSEISEKYPNAEKIDLNGKVVFPGFI
ncbi:MAG: amidohydrolase, partial [Ignavibacteria bacterium]|nr:amidohydrolase [Ignavibacteria bacterium]